MPDQNLICVDCKGSFIHAERDQAFYAQKGFTTPKRCRPCRDAKKASRESNIGNR